VRRAEFYSADVTLPALTQRVEKPLRAQAGMPMFRLAATGSKGFSDGIFE